MIQAMGATTVAVDLSELYLALRQGVADGQDTPAVVVKSNKFYEVQKYISKTEHVLTTAYTGDQSQVLRRAHAEEKTAFNSACKNANEFLRAYTVKDESEAYDFLKAQGMQVEPHARLESFRVATSSVIEKNPDLFLPSS
jgi:TRAP-type C4-dicarboxylate transport system substrate-binding protein